ncbi:MAG: glycosyl hydrolase 108 family protein [Acidobacteriaceae bacterium]|nr:glycosyl hydrolase 108 family protein [Acidobacteriaceae bacterium]
MAIGNLSACMAFTLGEEGGYSKDPNDPGNWTGGACGLGSCKGTKYGISAASYPGLDIPSLTIYQAELIYQRAYWQPMGCGALAAGVDLMAFDFAANTGVSNSARCLQSVLGVAQDGVVGPITIQAANATDPKALIALLEYAHEAHYRANPNFKLYGNGWLGRATRCQAVALGMV